MRQKILKVFILLTMSFFLTEGNTQDLYLIIGQSNAAGRALDIDSRNEDAFSSRVKYLANSNRIIKARQPLNRYSTIRKSLDLQGVNLGLEFGKSMYAYNGKEVVLVVNARGGTNIAAWRKGESTGYFSESVDRVKEAQVKCRCSLKGILWHQGESNVNSSRGTYTSSYFSDLKSLIEEYRDELGNVPFIVGQLAHKDANDAFNKDIKKVDDSDFGLSNVDWVTAKNLSTTDGTHFDAASTRLLGRRYAKVMKDYVSASSRGDLFGNNHTTEIESDYSLYPNPSFGKLSVNFSDYIDKKVEIVLTDFSGKVYLTKNLDSEHSSILDLDISAFQNGLYLLYVKADSHRAVVKKVSLMNMY